METSSLRTIPRWQRHCLISQKTNLRKLKQVKTLLKMRKALLTAKTKTKKLANNRPQPRTKTNTLLMSLTTKTVCITRAHYKPQVKRLDLPISDLWSSIDRRSPTWKEIPSIMRWARYQSTLASDQEAISPLSYTWKRCLLVTTVSIGKSTECKRKSASETLKCERVDPQTYRKKNHLIRKIA